MNRIIAIFEQVPQSFVSLLARIVVGLVFFNSGLTKIDGFHVTDSAIFLFAEAHGGRHGTQHAALAMGGFCHAFRSAGAPRHDAGD
jgi:uncharacterized membrane protein YphA (DoxX/SURF4 family)